MADKQVTLNFHLSDGTTESVSFTVPEGGGGSGGGINVIEYDPRLHEVVLDTVVGADFEPTRQNNTDDRPTSSWNPTTGVMTTAYASPLSSFPNNSAEYVGLRLTPSLYGRRGSFTIDASLCEDAWGFALLEHEDYGRFPIDLLEYMIYQHYTTVEYTALSQPQTFGWFLEEDGTYMSKSWVTDPFDGTYAQAININQVLKPQGQYTFNVNGLVTALAELEGITEAEVLAYLKVGNSPEQVATALSKTFVYSTNLNLFLELKADTPYLHFFMNAYHKPSQTGTHLLDPTSQLTITYNLETVENTVPNDAVDGDFLHLLDKVKLLGKDLVSGDFVQLYDNTSKMIVHANQP